MKKYLLPTVIAAALVLVVVLVRVYSVPRLRPAARGVRLTFLGLTNVPSHGRFAVFIVTNAGPERVAFDADALEYRTAQGWATNSLRNQTRRDWLCWDQDPAGSLKLGKWDDFGSDLRSGMSVMFGAPVTITDSVWRLDFSASNKRREFKGSVIEPVILLSARSVLLRTAPPEIKPLSLADGIT